MLRRRELHSTLVSAILLILLLAGVGVATQIFGQVDGSSFYVPSGISNLSNITAPNSSIIFNVSLFAGENITFGKKNISATDGTNTSNLIEVEVFISPGKAWNLTNVSTSGLPFYINQSNSPQTGNSFNGPSSPNQSTIFYFNLTARDQQGNWTFKAADSSNASNILMLEIVLTQGDNPPTVSIAANQSAYRENQTIQFAVTYTDPDGDSGNLTGNFTFNGSLSSGTVQVINNAVVNYTSPYASFSGWNYSFLAYGKNQGNGTISNTTITVLTNPTLSAIGFNQSVNRTQGFIANVTYFQAQNVKANFTAQVRINGILAKNNSFEVIPGLLLINYTGSFNDSDTVNVSFTGVNLLNFSTMAQTVITTTSQINLTNGTNITAIIWKLNLSLINVSTLKFNQLNKPAENQTLANPVRIAKNLRAVAGNLTASINQTWTYLIIKCVSGFNFTTASNLSTTPSVLSANVPSNGERNISCFADFINYPVLNRTNYRIDFNYTVN